LGLYTRFANLHKDTSQQRPA